MGAWLWVFSFAMASGCFTVVVPNRAVNRKLVHFKILRGSTLHVKSENKTPENDSKRQQGCSSVAWQF